MSEYQLIDLISNTSVAAIEAFAMYLTVMVGYLVASYTVGAQLTRFQVSTISTLYVVASCTLIWSTYGYMIRTMNLGDELLAINPERFFGATPLLRYALATIQIAGVLAALAFMWSMRHPRKK